MDGVDAVAQPDDREAMIDKLFEDARSGQQRAIPTPILEAVNKAYCKLLFALFICLS